MKLLSLIRGRIKKAYLWFLSSSLKKKLLVVVVIIVVAIVLFRILGPKKDNGYALEKVTHANIVETVSETGNVNTGASTDVISPSTGVVKEVRMANGDEVTVGDILFKVKKQRYGTGKSGGALRLPNRKNYT